MRRDTVVGLVGALILLFALIGVFRYESVNSSAGADYRLLAPKALTPVEGNAFEAMAQGAHVNVSDLNLTALDFHLDASGGTFNLTATAPDGAIHAIQGSAPLVLHVFLASIPQNGTALVESHAGDGVWNVTVTLVQAPAPGGPVPTLPPGLPGQTPAGVAYKLTPYAIAYGVD